MSALALPFEFSSSFQPVFQPAFQPIRSNPPLTYQLIPRRKSSANIRQLRPLQAATETRTNIKASSDVSAPAASVNLLPIPLHPVKPIQLRQQKSAAQKSLSQKLTSRHLFQTVLRDTVLVGLMTLPHVVSWSH